MNCECAMNRGQRRYFFQNQLTELPDNVFMGLTNIQSLYVPLDECDVLKQYID